MSAETEVAEVEAQVVYGQVEVVRLKVPFGDVFCVCFQVWLACLLFGALTWLLVGWALAAGAWRWLVG